LRPSSPEGLRGRGEGPTGRYIPEAEIAARVILARILIPDRPPDNNNNARSLAAAAYRQGAACRATSLYLDVLMRCIVIRAGSTNMHSYVIGVPQLHSRIARAREFGLGYISPIDSVRVLVGIE